MRKLVHIQVFIQHIISQFYNTSIIEWLAFLFGVAQVVLAAKNLTINFYFGIVSVSLYIYVFYSFGLFAESTLNIYYLILSIIGILKWNQGKNLPITYTQKNEWLIVAGIFLVACSILFLVLKQFTTSTVPFLDAFVSAVAWAGTWMMIKRKVENWLILNISNLVAIPLQFYKGLELTSLLTIIYVVIAIQGYFAWRKEASLRNN